MRIAKSVFEARGKSVDYKTGTMIELPRAALLADQAGGDGRVFLVRHQRPDADDLRHLAR